jgi:hypothetical protein
MLTKMSSVLGLGQNVVRSVANVTGNNAVTDFLDDKISTLKSSADGASSEIEGTKKAVGDVGHSVGKMKDGV